MKKNLISICSVRLLRSCCRFHVTYNQHALSHQLTFSLWSSLLFPSLVPSPMPILYLPQSCVPISPSLITGARLQLLCCIFLLSSAEFCDKCIHQIFLLCMQFWVTPWCLVCTRRPKERTSRALALIRAALTAQKDVKRQFAYSVVGPCSTDFLCRRCTCKMDRDFFFLFSCREGLLLWSA